MPNEKVPPLWLRAANEKSESRRRAAVHAEVNVPRWVWVLPHVLWAGEERTVWSE